MPNEDVMMALNAETGKRDNDGSESQNWKYDEDGSERRHWEVIMMALNAEWRCDDVSECRNRETRQ